MDRRDAEKVIQNLRTKPFICSEDCLLLDNGYVILRKENFDDLRERLSGGQGQLRPRPPG